MRNTRTTVAGVLTIVGALVSFAAKWIATGVPPGTQDFALVGAAFTVGAGLIAAADGRNLPPGAP